MIGRVKLLGFVTLLACAVLAAAPAATHAAAVVVAPADTAVSVGDDFWIRVQADAFPDLKGYQLIFEFDPTIVQLLGAAPGNVLTDSPGAWFGALVPDVVAPPDSAWYDAARLDGATAGPGVLVYFHFKALQEGVSPVACRHVDYRDSNNAQTLPGCTSGQIRVIGAVLAQERSWGRVKALYR